MDSRSNSSAATSPVLAGTTDEEARISPLQGPQAELVHADWVPLQLDLCREVAQEISGKCAHMGWLASAVSTDCLSAYEEDNDRRDGSGTEVVSEAATDTPPPTPLTPSDSSTNFFMEQSSAVVSDCDDLGDSTIDENGVSELGEPGESVSVIADDNVVTVTCGSYRCVSVVPITMTCKTSHPVLTPPVSDTGTPEAPVVACDVLGTVVLHVPTSGVEPIHQPANTCIDASTSCFVESSDPSPVCASSVTQPGEFSTFSNSSADHSYSPVSNVSLNNDTGLTDQMNSTVESSGEVSNDTVIGYCGGQTPCDSDTGVGESLLSSPSSSPVSEQTEVSPVTCDPLLVGEDVPSPHCDITVENHHAGVDSPVLTNSRSYSPISNQQLDILCSKNRVDDSSELNDECDGKINDSGGLAISSACNEDFPAEIDCSQHDSNEDTRIIQHDESPKFTNSAKSKIALKSKRLVDRSSSNDIERKVSKNLFPDKSQCVTNSVSCRSSTSDRKKLVKSISYDRIPKVTTKQRATSIACGLDKLTTCNYAKTSAPVVGSTTRCVPPTRLRAKTRSSNLMGKSSSPGAPSSDYTDTRSSIAGNTSVSSASFIGNNNRKNMARDNTRSSPDAQLRQPAIPSTSAVTKSSTGAGGPTRQNSSCRVVAMVRKPNNRSASSVNFSAQSLSRLPTPLSLPTSRVRSRVASGGSQKKTDASSVVQQKSVRSPSTSGEVLAFDEAVPAQTPSRLSNPTLKSPGTSTASSADRLVSASQQQQRTSSSIVSPPRDKLSPSITPLQQRSAVPKSTRLRSRTTNLH